MSNFADTQVLIVGAGPSGLMLACQLSIYGVPFRIIDKKAGYANYSGALFIQAKTLEIFDKMGVAEKAINQGQIVNSIQVSFGKKRALSLNIKNFGKGLSKIPYILMLEQGKTEQLLCDYLNERNSYVERNTELLSFIQDKEIVNCELKLANGTVQTCKTSWLIAADGGQSFIRQHLNIPFKGIKHTPKLFILDCKAQVNLLRGQLGFFFSGDSIKGVFPLSNKCRIDGNMPEEYYFQEDFTHEEIKKIATRQNPNFQVQEILHFSTFHARGFLAESFQQNRCFLIGDAAHVFSPVGAQGMNTGLQDAYNLGWKLSFVIKHKASVQLLKTYEAERQILAKKLVKITNRVSNMLLSKKNTDFILPFFIKILFFLNKSLKIQHFIFRSISGVANNYRETCNKNTSFGSFPITAPKPGDPLPYVFYDNGKTSIQHVMKEKFCLLIFSGAQQKNVSSFTLEKYKDIVQAIVIPFIDENLAFYKQFGIKKTGMYLVRPDSYIAFRNNSTDFSVLENYLKLKLFFQ